VACIGLATLAAIHVVTLPQLSQISLLVFDLLLQQLVGAEVSVREAATR